MTFDETDDMSEAWREYGAEKRRKRQVRRAQGTEAILKLEKLGFAVKAISDYHFRIDGVLDLYPTNGKWHHVSTGRRGRFKSARKVTLDLIGRKSKEARDDV